MPCPGSDDPNAAERCFNATCIGTYVSPSGSNSNPGTRLLPKATISGGLSVATQMLDAGVAQPVPVFVGVAGTDAGVTFFEDIALRAGIDLQGGWSHDRDGGWDRNQGAVTTVRPTDSDGVVFYDTASTRSNTRFSRFVVQGTNAATGEVAGCSVSWGAKPTLEDVVCRAGNVSGTGSSIGLMTSRGGVANGTATSPHLINSSFLGGTASRSVGMRMEYGSPLIERSTITGGTGTNFSNGLECIWSCAGTTITGSTISGGTSDSANGAYLGGVLTNFTITNSTLTGGPSTTTGSGIRSGLRVLSNAVSACSGTLAVSSSTLLGVRGAGVFVTGATVETACLASISTSTVVGVAPAGGPIASGVGTAYGVRCEGTSTCTLTGNTELAGVRSQPGLSPATASVIAAGVYLAGTAVVERNGLISGGDCVPNSGQAVGVWSVGTTRVVNNAILGGQCPISAGMIHQGTPATVINNHIDAVGTMTGTLSSGVRVNTSGGHFINNTILGGIATDRAAVREMSATADPAQLRNNNLYGVTVLYRDENATDLVNISQVESTVPNASGNLSADPLLVGPLDFHLANGSPNLDAGVLGGATTTGGVATPTDDFDGQNRPQPTGSNPDIGPDER